MQLFAQILFVIVLVAAIGLFFRNIRRIIRNIKLGKKIDRNDNSGERFTKMAMVAMGQSKMVKRPFSGFLHIIVYIGFIIINIEVLEIIIDGIFGTHRVLSFIGRPYDYLIGIFEVLGLLVLIVVILFWTRRNISNIYRFLGNELKGWPKNDANYILYFEMVIIILFLVMNSAYYQLQLNGAEN